MISGPANHTHHRFHRTSRGRRPTDTDVAPPLIAVEARHAIGAVRFEIGLEDSLGGQGCHVVGISIVRGGRQISRF